jgi:hypothetical protein
VVEAELVTLVSAAEVVDGSVADSVLEVVTTGGGAGVVSGLEVALLWRLASLTKLAMAGSSFCRASAALKSVGKIP